MPYVPLPEPPEPEDNLEESSQFDETAAQTLTQSNEASNQPTGATGAQLPPEAQGETNGGPLGCCFGVSMGLLLSVGIVSLSIPVLGHLTTGLSGFLAFLVNAAAVIFVIVATLALGVVGWKIGRRVFREYEPSPRQQRKMAQLQQRQVARVRQRRHV
ncbi:MAG TPA: hypothetical protein VNE38_04575 [Ktedonobacteraceae bacterium]|nr:hypothetical protein [Ktedonobacteraceae bacterium]